MAQLRGWLRNSLARSLHQVREAHEIPKPELDVLLVEPLTTPELAAPPIPNSLRNLAERLNLREPEQAVLAVLLGVALEPNLGRAMGLLCDPLGRDVVTWEALRRVLGYPDSQRFAPEDGLMRWGLLAVTATGLALDPVIEARLLGRPSRDAVLLPYLAIIPPHDPSPDWPVDELLEQIEAAVQSGARGVRLWLRGRDGSGRRTLFAVLARRLGLVGIAVGNTASVDVVRAATRLSWLDSLAPLWTEACDLPADLPPPPLQGWLDDKPRHSAQVGVVDLTVEVAPLSYKARAAVWRALVPGFSEWPQEEQDRTVAAWAVQPGQLADIARSGATTQAAALAHLHATTRQQLQGVCDVLPTTFDWDDLVLPESLLDSLKELSYEATTMPSLFEQDPELGRLFPQGRSAATLFSGPPGTGKTMAAQVIARSIGLPLFRIDLSRIVSKYIGETSQNLARVFEAGKDTAAIILFDEADALFGRRTEVRDSHDRYANTDTDYLLQALDTWSGVALLATNKRGNIDAAFLRRMRSVLDFPRPRAAERLRIWTRLITGLLPGSGDIPEGVVVRMAEGMEFTGAQIKSAILTARLVAARDNPCVTTEALVRGIERELEKEGRALSPRERRRLLE